MSYVKHILFLLLISSYTGVSQNIQDKYSLNIDSVLYMYKDKMHQDIDYVIGKEYKIYHSYKQDNPYLNARHGRGTIYSKGYSYSNKIILYDMHKDVIAVNTSAQTSSNINIELQKAQVDSFSIEFENNKYLFNHIKYNNEEQVFLASGFYEIPYKERFQLLLKHYSDKGESEGITTYTYKVSKTLKIENNYYNINNRMKFLKLFPTYKKQIKRNYVRLKQATMNLQQLN